MWAKMRGVETEWREAWWRHWGWETSFAGPGGNSSNPEALRSYMRGSWRLCTPSLLKQVHTYSNYLVSVSKKKFLIKSNLCISCEYWSLTLSMISCISECVKSWPDLRTRFITDSAYWSNPSLARSK